MVDVPSKLRQELSKGERSPNTNNQNNETSSARGSDNEASTGGSAMAIVKNFAKNVKNVNQKITKAMR